MRVILRSDVDGLGFKGDLVDVADGYARNYLVPNGLVFLATKGAIAQAESMRRAREVRDAAARTESEELARRLVSTPITITVRAGADGKLFGSVTAADVATAVVEQAGVELDRKAVLLDDHLKEVGSAMVQVRLHRDVEFPLTVNVVSE